MASRIGLLPYINIQIELLNQVTIKSIVTFNSKLDLHAKQIQDKIGTINKHLEAIEFNRDTYIRLQVAINPDPKILKFKESLKVCFSNIIVLLSTKLLDVVTTEVHRR